jgi:hypothetical protein
MTQYHVTLNSQGYLLDLDRYVKRIREPFVGKQGAGSVAVGDLRGPEQVLVISDWSGGEGYVQHDQDRPGRWRSGSGIDGFSTPGSLRLGPYVSVVGTTSIDALRTLQAYKTKLYAGGTAGAIYSWDGSTFTLAHTIAGTPLILAMDAFINVLYAGNGNNGNLLSFDGTTWTDVAGTAGGGIFSMRTHYREAAQYLYLGSASAGASGIGRIYYWDGAAVSTGQFDPEEAFPLAMFVLGEKLYVVAGEATSANWALYSVDDSGSGGQWRRHARIVGGGIPFSAVVHDGVAYIGDSLGGRLYSWDGSSLRIVIELAGPGQTYSGWITAPVSWRGAVWVGIQDASGGTLGVLRYDPTTGTISRPIAGLAGTDWRAGTVWADRLYLATTQPGAAKLMKVDPTLYGGSGTLESGLIDCGLPGVSKLLRSVTLVTGPMVSGHSVQVEYRLEDAGSWTSLGTLSTVGATTATYAFPSSTTCRQVSLRLALTGAAGTSATPVVHELALRYVPRPAITREWELAVVLEGTSELPLVTLDGEASPQTAAQLTSALWTAAGAAGPVTLVDLDGVSYPVYVHNVREEVGKISQRRAAAVGYQRLGVVTLVEAA